MKKVITVTVLTLASSAAMAGFFNGNQLYEKMRSSNERDRIYAMGIIAGVHDAGDGVIFCTPGSATLGQIFDVVSAALQVTPEIRHMEAALLISAALRAKWECPMRKDI